jgi:hypothetical protein
METPRDNYALALAGSELGHRFVPCRPGEKVPLVKWKAFQTEAPTPAMYEKWFKDTKNNIAVLTSGMVLFDCDRPDKEELVLGFCGETPWKVRTPRGGVHLGYRKRKGVEVTNQVRIRGEPIDIRTDGGLEILPFSTTEHGRYEFLGPGLVAVADLPVAKIGWTRERTRRQVVQAIEPSPDATFMELRATRWLEAVARANPAVSGQRGHDATFRVACKLTHYFGLGRDAAIRLMMAIYNPLCRPPWELKDIEHKVDDALKKRR